VGQAITQPPGLIRRLVSLLAVDPREPLYIGRSGAVSSFRANRAQTWDACCSFHSPNRAKRVFRAPGVASLFAPVLPERCSPSASLSRSAPAACVTKLRAGRGDLSFIPRTARGILPGNGFPSLGPRSPLSRHRIGSPPHFRGTRRVNAPLCARTRSAAGFSSRGAMARSMAANSVLLTHSGRRAISADAAG